MKKKITLLLSLVMMMSILIGCVPASESKESSTVTAQTTIASASQDGTTDAAQATETPKELTTLRVAVQPYYNSMQMAYIKDKGLDKANGLDLQPILFSNGATQNEALGAGLWDVALTGGAFVFGVANYDAKVIGSHIDGTGGNELYVRADSPIAKVVGYNPTYPTVLGDPETVKGAKIIIATGTTSQLCAVKWIAAIGVKEEDVEMLNMDYASGYQAFLTGEADVVVLVSPFCFNAPGNGWVKAADLLSLDAPNYEEIVASDDAYTNQKDALTTFLKLIYMANDALEANFDLKVEYTMKWYSDNANAVTIEQATQECKLKPLITSEKAKNLEMGIYEKNYADFMAMIDKLDASQADNVLGNVKPELLKAALTSSEFQ